MRCLDDSGYRTMQRKLLPIGALPAWANLCNVELSGVKISSLPGAKGSGIVAATDHNGESAILMKIPRELILSLENVWMYAKSDRNLREVLEASGDYARVLC